MKTKNTISPFVVITIFVLLFIVGLAFTPLLRLNLHPSKSLPSVTIYYFVPGATGELIDAEVTTPIEGALSTVQGVKKMTSRTSKDRGSIRLTMDKEVDMDAVRFEVSMLVRQLYSKLPPECQMPQIYANKPDEQNRQETLLAYHVNGKGSKNDIISLLNREVVPKLSAIKGVDQVKISGAEQRRMSLVYSPQKLKEYGITTNQIRAAINNQNFLHSNVGITSTDKPGEKIPVVFSVGDRDTVDISQIMVKSKYRDVALTDLVKVEYTTRDPRSYYRINGMNAVYLKVLPQEGANMLEVGKRVKAQMAVVEQRLPHYNLFTPLMPQNILKKNYLILVVGLPCLYFCCYCLF